MSPDLSRLSRSRAKAVSDELARQIIEQLSARSSDAAAKGVELSVQELVFEVDLGGEAYLFTCHPRRRPLASLGLSPREKEIVRLVAKGLPNKAIAQVLDISLWTVATHVRRIFAKLGVGTRAEMIAKTLQEGLLMSGAGEPKPTENEIVLANIAGRYSL